MKTILSSLFLALVFLLGSTAASAQFVTFCGGQFTPDRAVGNQQNRSFAGSVTSVSTSWGGLDPYGNRINILNAPYGTEKGVGNISVRATNDSDPSDVVYSLTFEDGTFLFNNNLQPCTRYTVTVNHFQDVTGNIDPNASNTINTLSVFTPYTTPGSETQGVNQQRQFKVKFLFAKTCNLIDDSAYVYVTRTSERVGIGGGTKSKPATGTRVIATPLNPAFPTRFLDVVSDYTLYPDDGAATGYITGLQPCEQYYITLDTSVPLYNGEYIQQFHTDTPPQFGGNGTGRTVKVGYTPDPYNDASVSFKITRTGVTP